MTCLVLLLIVAIVVIPLVYLKWHGRDRIEQHRRLLDDAAAILQGQHRPSIRERGRSAIFFRYEHYSFALYEESSVRDHSVVKRTVIQAEGVDYQGVDINIGHDDKCLGAETKPAHTNRSQELVTRYAQVIELENLDDESRQVLDLALDRRCVRIVLSSRGCWYECDGFSDNAELLAAGARTGAAALTILLDAVRNQND